MIFVSEKNYDGLMSAVHHSFNENLYPDQIVDIRKYKKQPFERYIYVKSDHDNARRIDILMRGYSGFNVKHQIKTCLASCEENSFKIAFDFVHFTLTKQKDVSMALKYPQVEEFFYATQKVLNEKQRLKDRIRFTPSKSGLMFATFKPMNDLCDLLSIHYLQCFNRTPYVLYDTTRGKIALSDGYDAYTGYTSYSPEYIFKDNFHDNHDLKARYINVKRISF